MENTFKFIFVHNTVFCATVAHHGRLPGVYEITDWLPGDNPADGSPIIKHNKRMRRTEPSRDKEKLVYFK